jgi:hypothetical protein
VPSISDVDYTFANSAVPTVIPQFTPSHADCIIYYDLYWSDNGSGSPVWNNVFTDITTLAQWDNSTRTMTVEYAVNNGFTEEHVGGVIAMQVKAKVWGDVVVVT